MLVNLNLKFVGWSFDVLYAITHCAMRQNQLMNLWWNFTFNCEVLSTRNEKGIFKLWECINERGELLVGEAHAFTIGKIDSILWFNTLNIHNFATHPLKPLHISLLSTPVCFACCNIAIFVWIHRNEMKHKQLCWDEISLVLLRHGICVCVFANRKSNFSASHSNSGFLVKANHWETMR